MATILLVDDEPDIRSLVRDVLGPQGYRILEAGNADEALRVAQEHGKPIDLLLTDVVMPGMHGHELAAQLLVQRPGSSAWLRLDRSPCIILPPCRSTRTNRRR
jgi:CheY-like chemotaxis protein